MPKRKQLLPRLVELATTKLASMGLTFGKHPGDFDIHYQSVSKRYGLFQRHPITGLERWPFGPEMMTLSDFEEWLLHLEPTDMMDEELSTARYLEHYAKQKRNRSERPYQIKQAKEAAIKASAALWGVEIIDEGFMVAEQRKLRDLEKTQANEKRRVREGRVSREEYLNSPRGKANEPEDDDNWDDIPTSAELAERKAALMDQAMSESFAGFSRERSGEWDHMAGKAVAPEREPDATGAAPLIQRGLFD